ncbi:MAG: hypothetical protein PT977_15825, partial [Acidobacteriota bacterium]|nr:hypothetical protein [Acidobacteriota bacterium]
RLAGRRPLGVRPALREALRGVPAPPGTASARGAAAVLGLGAAAYLGLHALAAGHVPPGVAADSVIEALRGLRLVLLRRFEVITVSIGPSAETLWLYVTGASVAALGPTRTSFLVPSILAATTTLVLVAALVRRIRPELPIYIALLVPASSLWLFHSGEVGLRASAAPLVLLGACFLLDDRMQRDVADRPFAAGALLGLGIYAYSACRLLPIAWVLHFALRWRRTPSARPALGREARLLILAFALVSIPNLLFLLRAPGLLLERGYYVSRGTPLDKLLNVLATFLLPFVYPDRYRVWIGPGHVFDVTGVALTASGVDPFDVAAGPLAVLGLLAWKRGKESAALSFLLVAWAAGSVLLGLYGPSLTRLLVLLPAWLVFAALGCDALLSRAPRLKVPLATLLVLSMCLQARAWVSTFGRSEPAAWYFHEAATAMAERARDLTRGGRRVIVVSRSGRDVFKYFCWQRIEQVFHTAIPQGKPRPEDVPLAGFAADVVLVERTPALDAWGATLGTPSRSTLPSLFAEYERPHAKDAPPPTVRSNLWRLWSPMAL